jgi:WD domain, G-beta repeat
MKPLGRVGWLAGLAAAVLSIGGTGCKKEKDSLIIASVKTEDSNGGTLRTLTLTVVGVSQTFPLTAGLTTSPIEFGLYLPSDVTGTVNVSASASEPTGCRGYKGEQSADVSTAGSTVPVTITLKPATVCQPDGGAAGSTGQAGASGLGGASGASGLGGASGQAGAAGTLGSGGSGGHAGGGSGSGGSGAGGAPPPGTPPSLKTCVEYEHDDSSVTCNTGGDTAVWSVAFSPNGQLLVTAGDDGRAVVWRFDGRKPTLEGHVLQGSGYGLVAFSPDGTQLAYGGAGQIALYTVATWALSRTLAVTNTIVDLAYTLDGQQIISSDSDGTIGNVYSHSALAGGSLSPTHTLAFSAAIPNAVAVAAGTANGTPVAVATGSSGPVGKVLIYSLTSTGFVGPSSTLAVSSDSGAYTVRISPNGSQLASAGADGLVYLWPFPITSVTPSTPNIDVGTAFGSDNVDMVAFSPNSSYIAVAAGFFQSASIWGVAPPRSVLGSNVVQSNDLVSITFSPSGNAIVAGEYDCGLFQVCAD